MKTRLLLLLTLILGLSLPTFASGQVQYSDSFSRVTGSGEGNGNPAGPSPPNGFSEWGTADNALGGTQTVDWIAGRLGDPPPNGGAQFTTNGSRAHLFSGAVHTTVNVAAALPDGFSVAFDFGRVDIEFDPTNGFISMGTGYDETISEFSPFEVTGNSQFSILFQQAANGNVGNSSIFVDGILTADFDYGDPLTEHSVLIEFTPNVPGGYTVFDIVNYAVSIDGNMLQSGSISGGDGFGDLAFATNLFTAPYIDNLVVSGFASIILGDVNMDGVVNLLDVAPFVALISTGQFQAEADINGDGVVNLLDVQPFVDLIAG